MTFDPRFDHIPPYSAVEVNEHAQLRTAFKLVAQRVERLPQSRETSLALTKLEESLFWANASVARNLSQPKHDAARGRADAEALKTDPLPDDILQ